ncbi:protein kinase [Phytophthora infestans T30-4]|uniref:Protein kinase n=1 Tax=Phytophthora infestans (strain T30-4) TaxID=403677 RepID=D0NDG4_PHYIT|nr:protein kinase [Phytophthora infestans T30-4]EEY56121.1 protein kinase [Phytophthora infestans T30-4]|eukprot:XP_002902951.1 protein kinase [Phytophthora infestans T30-4]
MPYTFKRVHTASFVVFRQESDHSSDAGNATVTSEPDRIVQGPTPTSSSSDGSSLSDDELGLAVGGGLMIVVLFCILFVGHKRRRRMDKNAVPEPSPGTLDASSRRSPAADELYVLDSNSFMSSSISFGSRVSCFLQEQSTLEEANETWHHPQVIAVRVSVSEISLDELVARGTNSEVYRGQYRDRVVAIKKPLPHWLADRNNLDAFFANVKVLSSPSLTHPNVVSFLGVSWRSLAYVCLVSELMAGGDLRSLLSRRQHHHALVRDEFSRRGFNRQKISIATQVVSALSFLHSQGLVHGAIRSRNVLLDENLNAKLSGFQGSSVQSAMDRRRMSHESSLISVPPRLLTTSVPIGVADRLRRERTRVDALWSAPEALRGERSNAKTDVFSFGVILCELDSLAAPYGYSSRFGEQGDSAELLEKVAAGHVRVHFTSSGRARHGRRGSSSPSEVDTRITAAIVRLGKACVALDAFERPSAAQVSAELHKLLQTPDPKLSLTLSKQGPTTA